MSKREKYSSHNTFTLISLHKLVYTNQTGLNTNFNKWEAANADCAIFLHCNSNQAEGFTRRVGGTICIHHQKNIRFMPRSVAKNDGTHFLLILL